MFQPAEDCVLTAGTVWHGTAICWHKQFNRFISEIPIISNRFCIVRYEDKDTQLEILSYDKFIEVLDSFDYDIGQNKASDTILILGADANCSEKSSSRRQNAMKKFVDKYSF